MARKRNGVDERALTKGELRKLRALRKSIGDQLGNDAFRKWYAKEGKGPNAADPNVDMIEKALNPLAKKLRIARGVAYAVRRGRGRFIVEPVELKD